ncbi:uncharacterized protein LOC130447534 [Diorhabda sublineata]|uniref:uncharacterized protein LOC130447534 n=1 Tax=Diorhabda sublineata TaxID=1163346 RepID=UPI0024E1602C|nr:uncharacterized protein LOC130447534 [Diorhabda sublineata]
MNNVHLAKVFDIVCLLAICIFVHLKLIICCELWCRVYLLNMSKRVKACCVPGCTNKQAKRHSIPTNEDVCRIWLQRINNPKLMLADTVLSSHRICDIHFEPICRNPNGRLKKVSLPTLLLPGYKKGENDIFWIQEQPSSFSTPKKLIELIVRTSSSINIFSGNSPIEGTKKPVKVYTRKRLFQALVEEPCSSSSILYEPSISTNMETNKLGGHSTVTDILASFPLGQTSLTPSTSTELKVQIPIRVYGRRSQPFIDSETSFMLQPSTSQAVDDVLDPPVAPSKDREDMKQTVIKDEIEIHDDFICNTKVKQELSDEIYSVAFQNVNTISTRPIKQEISDDLNTIQLFEQSMVTIKTEECTNMVDKPKIPNNFEYSRIKSGKETKSQGLQKCLKHLILNSINGIIICESCGNLYTKRIEFIRHFSTSHYMKKKFYQTNKCSKKKEKTDTAVNRNVDVDVKNETVEDDWKKEDIRFAANFTSSIYECQNLKRNDANATKNFLKCDICLKNFSPKSRLKTHLRSHTEEKRNSHVRTHTGKNVTFVQKLFHKKVT